MGTFLKLFIIVFTILEGFGTTFIPIPFEKQVRESHAVMRGIYQGSSYKKLNNGDVVTEASFKVLKTAGVKHNDVINKNDFKVLYPGGIWQGVVYHVYGAPKFKKGEEVILLLTKSKHGFAVNNMALGKYEIYQEDGREYISSSIFPSHPSLGRIEYKDFEKTISKEFGSYFENVHSDKYVYSQESSNTRSPGRRPANKLDETKDNSSTNINIFWLVILFALLGLYSTLSLRKRDR